MNTEKDKWRLDNKKQTNTETKQKTNKETVPGGSLVYVMVKSLSQASRSLP